MNISQPQPTVRDPGRLNATHPNIMEIAIVKKLFLFAFLPLLLLAACSDDDNTTQPPTGDTEKPSVTFVKPANDQQFSEATLDVELTATDNVGVVKIELYVNTASSPAVTLQNAPWQTALDVSALTPGTHTIRAKAYDAAGNASNFVAVTVVKLSRASSVSPSVPERHSLTMSGTSTRPIKRPARR
ncbi:MAG: Ig-like domain-containing protein [Bacteroidia bacterium]|nr:Ig-like domain-containing protein [Bacteroidia bacterium]